jgi:cell division protein FtsW
MTDKKLFISASIMILMGVLFSYSLSVYTVIRYDYNQFHFFLRQFITGLVAIFLMWGISKFNPDKVVRFLGLSIFLVCMVLMVAMHMLPESIVSSAGGAKRWIRLPGFSLSPVEFFKIGFVYFLAWSFSRKISHEKKTLKDEIFLIFPYLLVFGVVIFLIAVMQNDLGQVVLLGVTLAVMMMLAGGMRFRTFALFLVVAIIIIAYLIYSADHRVFRVQVWWSNIQDFVLGFLPNSWASSLRVEGLPEPYQIGHSLNAIHNGGIFGNFYGNGDFKYGFLTEVHTDFVLSGMIEEIGLIGIIFILFLFLTIIYRILKIANRTDNKEYSLFCVGVALVISIAFIINAFGISGITPIKGIAVPFLSYGGSGLIALSIALGMVLSISKRAKI